jgi:hypothetical protein
MTQILPGRDRLKRSQNDIFFLIFAKMLSKLPCQAAGLAEIFIPRIFVSPQKEKLDSRSRPALVRFALFVEWKFYPYYSGDR